MPTVVDLEELTENVNNYIMRIGPVWQRSPDGNYRIPERTIGWHAIAWMMEHLTNGEKGEEAGPFMLTPEQARFVLWWYALDEHGNFLYTEGQLQRLKGWGKDPLVTFLSLFEGLGECRFNGWEDDAPLIPKVKEQTLPLIQVAAVTSEQTDSTMRLYRHYLSDDAIRKFRIEINTEAVKSHGITVIKSITSNPEALEGKSPTFVIVNEPHHWTSNVAREMWKVIARNAVKVKGGASRVLSITNAYDPNKDSVAQETRKTWENQMSRDGSSKILYDSVEVSPDTPLWLWQTDETGREKVGDVDKEPTREWLGTLIEIVRGDSKWSMLDRIVDEFFNDRNPPDHNKRFWLNSIVSSEGDWIDIRDYDKCVRQTEEAKIGIQPGDQIAMFGDFSKSDDSSVLMGCRISDGYVFKIAAWHKPRKGAGPVGMNWLVPRNERDRKRYDNMPGNFPNPYKDIETVDEAVERAFRQWKVVGFFADPSHAKEDVTNKMYWDEAIEKWHIKYSKELKVWAGSRTGLKSESISWDMINAEKIEEFAEYAERMAEMIMRFELLIQNEPDVRSHFSNARVYKTRSGLTSIWKGKKNSDKKIDLAIGAIGALMVRSKYLKQFGNKPVYNQLSRFM